MFKRIKYELGAMFGKVKVEIWVEDGELHYSKDVLTRPDEAANDEISTVSVEEFSKKMEALRVSNWKKNYWPQGYEVLDGEFWDVNMKIATGGR